MLNAGAATNNDRCLVIDGLPFDAIGFAVDRRNLAEMRRLCSALKVPAPWRAAVRKWARGEGEFLVMYANAAAYDDGSPEVVVCEDRRAFELSIHSAVADLAGQTLYWNACLDKAHEDRLRLALYVDTHITGTC
jgi:hypothetical protein